MSDIEKRTQALVTELRDFCVTLSKDERKRLLRGRRDAELMISRVHALATKMGVTVPGIPLSGMQNDVSLVAALVPFEAALSTAQGLVEDTMAQADSEAWQAFLAYYGVLASMAPRNAEIEAQLAPVVEFMRTPRKRPGEPAPNPPQPG